jgi:DNA-directed RNA polymerase subunit L
MSETNQFTPKYSDIRVEDAELRFVLSGNDEYGFDKSVVNAIRRTLLTDIPTVGFKLYPNGENNDLIMATNESSLHNEMLLHRISFMPYYIDPENYMRNHLFECKVKHDGKEPFRFVTLNDINIYPLNSGLSERLEKLFDDSYDLSHEDEKIIREKLSKTDLDNYDLTKPLSQKAKDEIFRPFKFRGQEHYCMITELKQTNTEGNYQELHFYGSLSVGYGSEDAKFQGVSQATYSFKTDDKLVDNVLMDRIKLDKIEKDDVETYSRKFKLREAERYYYRDDIDESNVYDFSIKSCHYYDSSRILKVAVKLLIQKCENFKLQMIEYLKDEESIVTVDEYKENIYHIEVEKESHTLGNLYQSHMMRYLVDDKTLVNIFGYKKPHPLEDKILFIVSLNPGHKLVVGDEVSKITNMFTFLIEGVDSLINDLRILSKVTDKAF